MGREIAGRPANDAGTVRTSCTYAETLLVSLSDSESEVGERRGAGPIADGCRRTCTLPSLVLAERDEDE